MCRGPLRMEYDCITILRERGFPMRLLFRLISTYYTTRAVRRGRYPQRVARKYAYRAAGRAIRRIIR